MSADIERLLYHEAHLLDSGRYHDWLALLAPDLRYWAPVRADVPRDQERVGEAGRLPLFDETKPSLSLRVSRLDTGAAWIDIPPTRTRRFVTNIVADVGEDGRIHVRSNFLVFRSRSFSEDWIVAGCREDVWTAPQGGLLKERKILLDHCTVENLPLFL